PKIEVMETLMELLTCETSGMVVLQAESETASINMVYGGASAGKKVMTSSSSPGISLMCEGFTYLAGAELPCLVVDVVRGGPGLGSIQAAQSDYTQLVKGGGHGDYRMIVLAPASVQDMNDFVGLGFDLAFKYRIPTVILSDGVIGQMMEKVKLSPVKERWTDAQIEEISGSWATTGRKNRKANTVTSLFMDSADLEKHNYDLQAKYRTIEQNEVRYTATQVDDAEYVMVAYGTSARVCQKVVEDARADGFKVGLIRPITLFPFPTEVIKNASKHCKAILSVEMSAGQMVEDVRLAVAGGCRVEHYGRYGGIVHSPTEVYEALKELMK
ncbi:MAG: 3-methyl-2-oxobutanoate dehydrogenase subunit VorB, partial [Mucinivorans sp.]